MVHWHSRLWCTAPVCLRTRQHDVNRLSCCKGLANRHVQCSTASQPSGSCPTPSAPATLSYQPLLQEHHLARFL